MIEQNDGRYEPEKNVGIVAIALGVLVLLTVAWCWWNGDLP